VSDDLRRKLFRKQFRRECCVIIVVQRPPESSMTVSLNPCAAAIVETSANAPDAIAFT